MRRFFKAGLVGMSVLMLATGCSKKAETDTETGAASASDAAETTAEYVEGELKSLGEYKGLSVEIVEVPEITDADVEAQIQFNLAANPEEEVVTDRGAEDGDTVNIDFKGYKDGVAFDGGEAAGYDLVLGSGSFIEGFEEGLIGVKAGDEKELNLTFPEDYMSADLAGADVVFEVTVNEVKVQKDAELNDEFVKRVSDKSATVEEYRQEIREELEAIREMSIENYISNQIMAQLVETSDIVCGSDDLEAAFATQKANFESQIMSVGGDMETYLTWMGLTQEEYEEKLMIAAENAVKQEMIIDEIIAREGIEADDAAREKVAFMYDETVDSLTAVIGENMMDKMAAMQNALEFLCENAEVTVVETTAAADTAAAEAALDDTAADDAAEASADAAGTETDTAAEAEAE